MKIDEPVEVSKSAYNIIMTKLAGTCFGREENGKYFIKPAFKTYFHLIEKIISSNP